MRLGRDANSYALALLPKEHERCYHDNEVCAVESAIFIIREVREGAFPLGENLEKRFECKDHQGRNIHYVRQFRKAPRIVQFLVAKRVW